MQPVRQPVGGVGGYGNCVMLPKLRLESPLGFRPWQKCSPGDYNGRIVPSRFLNERSRPSTSKYEEHRVAKEYLWDAVSPRPILGTPRPVILEPLPEMSRTSEARKSSARRLTVAEMMENFRPVQPASARRSSNPSTRTPKFQGPTTVHGTRRKMSLLAQAAMDEFSKVDGDSNEGLDFEEFKTFFLGRLGDVPAAGEFARAPDADKREWFSCLDVDEDGHLSRGELFGFVLLQASLIAGEYDLIKLLRSYKELRGSTISFDQLTSVVVKNGFPAETAKEVMNQIDTNRSGVIEFAELGQWVRKAKIGLKVNSTDARNGGLSALCAILARGRSQQEEEKEAQIQKRIDAFAGCDERHKAVNKQLGTVMTTRRDVLAAERLGLEMRQKVREQIPPDLELSKGVLHLVCAWDLMKTDGLISVRELHQGLVLLGIEDASAGAVQELFDEIDEDGTNRVTHDDLHDFIVERDADEPFRRRENEFLKDDVTEKS